MKKYCYAAMLLAGLAASQAEIIYGPWRPVFKGIDHTSGTNTAGYQGQHIVQAVRVDLHDPDVSIFTTPPVTNNWVADSRETLGMRPSEFLEQNRLKVAINGAHYGGNTSYSALSGLPDYVHGLAVSQGLFVSPPDSRGDQDSLMYFSSNKVPSFIAHNTPPLSSTNGMHNAIPGMYALVEAGVNISYNYLGQGSIHNPQPRTAIGYSSDGRYLILITIDGRQSDSTGAVDYETADWLIRFGAYTGMNLDGGGSTCMVMANDCGNAFIVNDPSIQYAFNPPRIGWQRAVGHNVGIKAKDLPAKFMQNPLATPGRAMAIVTWETAAPATTRIEFGSTPALGNFTPLEATLVTNHQAIIAGLTPGATNYYRLISVANNIEYSTPMCMLVTLTAGNPVVYPSNDVTTVYGFDHSWTFTSDNMDGTAWKTRSYNDSGWMGSGPSLLYAENNAYVNPKVTPLPSVCGLGVECSSGRLPRTFYFRTHFEYPTNVAGTTLMFSNYLDDGAVFYLNGAEIHRLYMPAAPMVIDNQTLAIGFATQGKIPQTDPRYGDASSDFPEIFTLSGPIVENNLVQGDNVLAVEVHNYAPTSPDLVFGSALFSVGAVQTTNALVVLSGDPATSIPITVTPTDNYGDGQGNTPLERIYYSGASATLTAPANVGGKVFQKWQRDGADYSASNTVQVSMDSSHVLVAVYGSEPAVLAVNSQNPNSGVSISISPNDIVGQGNGLTPLSRTYAKDATVTLTAPANAGVNYFLKWQQDSVDLSTNRAVQVTMNTNHTLTAVYTNPVWTLTVASVNPDTEIPIDVAPTDSQGNGNGQTPFERNYLDGASVTLTAPATAGVKYFLKWQQDGVDLSTNRAVQVTINTNHNLTAVYATPVWTLTLASINPDTEISIGVVPTDSQGNGNGQTPFERNYLDGASVTLTAPATAGVNRFLKWQQDGLDLSTNPVVQVTLDTNRFLTAVYVTPRWTLSLASTTPDNGVPIGITPADDQGNRDGETPFDRIYPSGTAVNVTAPAAVGENRFEKWTMDGLDHSTNLTIHVWMGANRQLTAVFLAPPAKPPLTIESGDRSVIINWTNAGFTLQYSTNLSGVDWLNVPGPVTNGPYTNAITEPAQFFRLRQ